MRILLLAGLVLATPASALAQCYTAREGSNYDFVPAGGTLYSTDFSGDAPGDFPASLEYKEGSLEVVRWNGRPALKASSQSTFVVPLAGPLPERFTVEIGVVNRNTKQVGAETIAIQGGKNPNPGQGTVRAEYGPILWQLQGGGANASAQFGSDDADVCIGQETMVRLMVDGERVRFYADERRLASIPNARFQRGPGLVVSLAGRDDSDNAVYVTSIRVAGGTGAAAVASTAPPSTSTTAPTTATTAAGTQPTTTATLTTAPVSAAATTGTATTAEAPAGAIAEADRAANLVTAAPPAPTGLQASYARAGRWAFTWSAVPNAAGYEVWVRSQECAAGCRVTLSGLTDTSVVSASTFDYTGPVTAWVRALGADGQASPNSAPLSLAATPRYKGVYRVTVTGLRVNRETFDNPAEIDGKRDEVLVRARARLYDARQTLLESGGVISKVHGDRNADSWSLATSPQVRIKAGTASILGGLRTGDEHRAAPGVAPNAITFPLLVWEGSLREGEQQLVIAPSIWEVDRAPAWEPIPLPEPERELLEAIGDYAAATYVAAATQQVEYTSAYLASLRRIYAAELGNLPDWTIATMLRWKAMQYLSLLPKERVAADSVDDVMLAEAARIRGELGDMGGAEAYAAAQTRTVTLQSALLGFYSNFAPTLAALMNNADRPIGIRSEGGQQRFDVQLVRLDFGMAERVIAGAHGGPPGEIQLRYIDRIATGGGDYTLFLKVERLQ